MRFIFCIKIKFCNQNNDDDDDDDKYNNNNNSSSNKLIAILITMKLYQLGCKFLDVSFLSHFLSFFFCLFFLFHIQEHSLSDPMKLLFHSFMEEADSKYWKQFLAKTNFYSRLGEFKSCNTPFTSTYVQKCT